MNHKPTVLILGSGEIARCLARLADVIGLPVTVCENNVHHYTWPEGTGIHQQNFSDQPWPLPPDTHAIIARGHEGDAESVASLLNHGAKRVYLIASARRAQSVIEQTAGNLENPKLLDRLSAPAGLDLGGNDSMEIAFSILAEIQLRHYETSGQALCEVRNQRIKNRSNRQTEECPGKRV